jgi:uncharacterized protein
MIRPVIFATEKGNHYLYSPSRNQFTLSHPLVNHFYSLEQDSADIKSFLKNARNLGRFTLDGFGTFSYPELISHYRKYNFLKKQGFFKSRKRLNLEGGISPADIEDNIGRIKQLIFEVTEDCNLSCAYCTYSKFYVNKARASREPNLEEIRKTIIWFLERRKVADSLLTVSFYGGEPLKNMKLISDVVAALESIPGNHTRFKFTMTSNGVYLKKYIAYLAEHDFEVGISLDGDSKGNAYRLLKNNRPSYSIVIRNLDYVQEHYPEFFEKNINFMSVMHNRNNFGALEQFFREKYNKSPLLADINTVGISDEYKAEFFKTFLANKKDDRDDKKPMERLMMKHPRVKDLADMVDRYSGMVFKNHYQMLQPGRNNTFRKKYIPTATCTPFSMRAFMTTEGKILPCEHIGREFEIGSADANGPRIDNTEISDMFNRYYRKIKTFCDKCYLSDNCKECMFNAGVETDKPSCEFFMSHRKFSDYLARHYSSIENDYPFFLTVANHAFRKEGS